MARCLEDTTRIGNLLMGRLLQLLSVLVIPIHVRQAILGQHIAILRDAQKFVRHHFWRHAVKRGCVPDVDHELHFLVLRVAFTPLGEAGAKSVLVTAVIIMAKMTYGKCRGAFVESGIEEDYSFGDGNVGHMHRPFLVVALLGLASGLAL